MTFSLSFFSKILFCILCLAFTLYAYIDRRNEIIKMRLQIPERMKQLHSIAEENKRLEYEIDRFNSPIHLMELARKPEFGHLRYPYNHEIINIIVNEPEPLGVKPTQMSKY